MPAHNVGGMAESVRVAAVELCGRRNRTSAALTPYAKAAPIRRSHARRLALRRCGEGVGAIRRSASSQRSSSREATVRSSRALSGAYQWRMKLRVRAEGFGASQDQRSETSRDQVFETAASNAQGRLDVGLSGAGSGPCRSGPLDLQQEVGAQSAETGCEGDGDDRFTPATRLREVCSPRTPACARGSGAPQRQAGPMDQERWARSRPRSSPACRR